MIMFKLNFGRFFQFSAIGSGLNLKDASFVCWILGRNQRSRDFNFRSFVHANQELKVISIQNYY